MFVDSPRGALSDIEPSQGAASGSAPRRHRCAEAAGRHTPMRASPGRLCFNAGYQFICRRRDYYFAVGGRECLMALSTARSRPLVAAN